MDNYHGQNKNGIIIKMVVYFNERGWYNTVNLIFLVNSEYNFKQAIQVLDTIENVMPMNIYDIQTDYPSQFDKKKYKQSTSNTIHKNDIFTVNNNSNNCNCIMITKRSHNAAVMSTQSTKRIDKYIPECMHQLDILYSHLQYLSKPGLKPIKQVYICTQNGGMLFFVHLMMKYAHFYVMK